MQQELLQFILDTFVPFSDEEITPTTSLFVNKVLDSLNLVTIISHVQQKYGIVIQPFEMTLENFGTVEIICDYIKSKQG